MGAVITELTRGRVLVSYGPLHMSILAEDEAGPSTSLAKMGAEFAVRLLEQVALFRGSLKRSWREVKLPEEVPDVVNLMVSAVRRTGDTDLTPMAAVAGSIAELAADYLASLGATRAVANNGGDIAIRLTDSKSVKVGIMRDLATREIGAVFELTSELSKWGVATSGFGGRSFTKGISSAVTVLAGSASVADACATLIANHVFVPDPRIRQLPAEVIDPDTDIPGRLVTVKIGDLDSTTVRRALNAGAEMASLLLDRGLVLKSWLYLGSDSLTVPFTS